MALKRACVRQKYFEKIKRKKLHNRSDAKTNLTFDATVKKTFLLKQSRFLQDEITEIVT